MKVKVSYTVDFDSIPNVVKDLVSKNIEKIESVKTDLEFILNGDMGLHSLQKLGNLKDLAMDMSESFADAEGILNGFFVNAVTKTDEQEKLQPDEERSDDVNT